MSDKIKKEAIKRTERFLQSVSFQSTSSAIEKLTNEIKRLNLELLKHESKDYKTNL